MDQPILLEKQDCMLVILFNNRFSSKGIIIASSCKPMLMCKKLLFSPVYFTKPD